MDRRTKVELFEQIRREYEHGGGTIRGIAKKLGSHRRMVREVVLSAVPVERKTPVRERPKLEPLMAFIDAVLEADRKAPRKQRRNRSRNDRWIGMGEKEKGRSGDSDRPLEFIPAATYVPTQLPAQYHRPGEA